jgi:uncharacterized protein YdeI (YjbR/CyaY-like superfamily)
MDIGKTLYVTNGKQWRSWLAKNHSKKKEIWLIYYMKSSNKPRIPYNDAVEEALCFGWIDSIVKRVDNERFCQRFTPRKPKSILSEMNKERIRRLIKSKRMTLFGLNAVNHAFDKDQKLIIAPDIIKAIRGNREAWKNFQKLSKGYKMVRIGYIEGYRDYSKKIFRKTLAYFIKMTAKNRKFGMVR